MMTTTVTETVSPGAETSLPGGWTSYLRLGAEDRARRLAALAGVESRHEEDGGPAGEEGSDPAFADEGTVQRLLLRHALPSETWLG